MAAPIEQIPPLDELVCMGQGALTSRRPEARQHVESGWYGAVLRGWGGQASICRRRLGAEVAATRLPLAEGEALLQLAESEYWAALSRQPREAVGEATLQRTVDNTQSGQAGNFTPGTLPAGAQLRRVAAASAQPPREEAIYAVREAVYAGPDDSEPVTDLGGGQYRHTQRIVPTLDAVRAGPHANGPEFVDLAGEELAGEIVSDLWDSSWQCLSLQAAGGQLEPGDEQVRAFAGSSHRGRLGPVDAAILAGAYSHGGIWRAILVDDPATGISKLYLADQSWAYSQALLADVGQVLLGRGPEQAGSPQRRWLGFGARVETRPVKNRLVTVQTTVTLRSPDYQEQTSEISDRIRDALTDYFDNRPDFWSWKAVALGGLISVADRRILSCDSVTVLDRDGAALSEPAAVVDPTTDLWLVHYYLVDQSLQVAYQLPS